jgi:hypothetical protein
LIPGSEGAQSAAQVQGAAEVDTTGVSPPSEPAGVDLGRQSDRWLQG